VIRCFIDVMSTTCILHMQWYAGSPQRACAHPQARRSSHRALAGGGSVEGRCILVMHPLSGRPQVPGPHSSELGNLGAREEEGQDRGKKFQGLSCKTSYTARNTWTNQWAPTCHVSKYDTIQAPMKPEIVFNDCKLRITIYSAYRNIRWPQRVTESSSLTYDEFYFCYFYQAQNTTYFILKISR
jgi:hypothetical protein